MKKQKKEQDTLPLTFAVFVFYLHFESGAARDEGTVVARVLLKQNRRQAYVQDYSGTGVEGAEASY